MKTILVVEDSEEVRQNIIELIEVNGYKAISAENGSIGLELAKTLIPDLIIADIMMPNMDGYELLEELKKAPITETIPIIFLTARSAHEDVRLAMKGGVDDYLTKPFRSSDLLDAINAKFQKYELYERKMEELRSNIALYIPHELRTPLVAILGLSEIIKEENTSLKPDDIYTMVDNIHCAGKRLHKSIEKFIKYTEIEIVLHDIELIKEALNSGTYAAADSIKMTLLRVADICGRKEDLKYNIVDNVLAIKENHLVTIIEELIENACKFSSKGTEVLVNTHIRDQYYVIEIKNKGYGIAREDAIRFGAFMQFNRKGNDMPGNGLGMIMVRKLTELHKGELKIDSLPGKYTSVIVSIPLFMNN